MAEKKVRIPNLFSISDFEFCHLLINAVSPDQSDRYFRFSTTITAAVPQASVFSHPGDVNSPILRRSLVNATSGITANESCKLRTTWLRSNNFAVPLAP